MNLTKPYKWIPYDLVNKILLCKNLLEHFYSKKTLKSFKQILKRNIKTITSIKYLQKWKAWELTKGTWRKEIKSREGKKLLFYLRNNSWRPLGYVFKFILIFFYKEWSFFFCTITLKCNIKAFLINYGIIMLKITSMRRFLRHYTGQQ